MQTRIVTGELRHSGSQSIMGVRDGEKYNVSTSVIRIVKTAAMRCARSFIDLSSRGS